MSTDHAPSTRPDSGGLSRRAVQGAVIMAALIGLFYLLREHGSHVAGYWSYLILLACPLMHLFHGHGKHHHHEATPPESTER